MEDKFLDEKSLIKLTGRKSKSNQIKQLHKQEIPFRVNALGEPIVLWSSLENHSEIKTPKIWKSNALV